MFPEITKKGSEIKEILDEEEESFSRTLDRGEKLFEQYASRARQQGQTSLSGKDVWRLYDTYGFPVDLTRLMAEELSLSINDQEFEEAQAQSKDASKATKKEAKDLLRLDVHDIAALEKNTAVPKTDDSPKFGRSSDVPCRRQIVELGGLVPGNITAKVVAVYHDKAFLESTSNVSTDATLGLILDRTNFYAEAGGQEYDTGTIIIDGVAEFEVVDVQTFNGYVLHIGRLKYGTLQVGDEVVSTYDEVSLSCYIFKWRRLTLSH